MVDEAQFSSTQPTHASASRRPVRLETDNRGNLKVTFGGTAADKTVLIGAGSAAIGVVDTELPAAAALADASALPTTPLIGAVLLGYNGATLDLLDTSSIGTGIFIAAPPDYSYLNIAAGQATTVVKASPGFLHGIVFNSAATAANVTTVYDHASSSGTVIAIPNAVAATVPNTLIFDCKFAVGLTIITTTQNGSNMTVIFR